MVLNVAKNPLLLLFDIFVIHNFLTSSAITLKRFDSAVPKHDDTIIFHHLFASSPDGSEPPFVFIANFFISSSSMLSYTIRRIFGIGPYCIASWDVCFASGCFNSYN